MPILGAFIWSVIAGLGRGLVWFALRWGGSFIANAALFLGLSLVAVKFATPSIKAILSPVFAAVPSPMHEVLAYVGIDQAVTIMLSAYAFKAALGLIRGIATKASSVQAPST